MHQTKKIVSLDCTDNDHISRLLPAWKGLLESGSFLGFGFNQRGCSTWMSSATLPVLVYARPPKKSVIWKVELLRSFVCHCHSIIYIYICMYVWRWLHAECVMQDIICAKTKMWDRIVDGLNAKRRNQEIKSWDDDISHASWDLISIEFSAVECTSQLAPISRETSLRNHLFWKNQAGHLVTVNSGIQNFQGCFLYYRFLVGNS